MAKQMIERVEHCIYRRGKFLTVMMGFTTEGGFGDDLAAARLRRDQLLIERELAKRDRKAARKAAKTGGVNECSAALPRQCGDIEAGKTGAGKDKAGDGGQLDSVASVEPRDLSNDTGTRKARKTTKKDGAYFLNGQWEACLNGLVYEASSAEEANAIIARRGRLNPCGKATASDYKPVYDATKEVRCDY